MKETTFSASEKETLKKYYRWRAAKAGSTNSLKKQVAARRASLITTHHLNNLKTKYPDLAQEIEAYQMSVDQERALRRVALIEKLEKLAN